MPYLHWKGNAPAGIRRSLLLLSIIWLPLGLFAAEPAAGDAAFLKEIAPILVAKCLTCHQPGKSKGDYQVHTYGAFLAPGRSKEPPIVPGRPQKSHLLQLLSASDPDDRMPQKDEPLTTVQIAAFRRWVESGAPDGGIDRDKPLSSLLAGAEQPPPPDRYPRTIPILALAFHPNGRELAAGGYHEVTVWDPSQGRLLRRIKNVARQVQQLSFSPDGRLLAVAAGTPGRQGEVKLFDAVDGTLKRTITLASDLMNAVAFSPDGRHLATAGADNTVSLGEIETGTPVFRSELNADWVMHLAFSPDGRKIASASRDKTVRVLEVKSGALDETYAGHSGPVFSVSFLGDGKGLVSGGRDRSLHHWQESDGKKLADASGLPGEILRLVVHGGRIFAGLSSGEIKEYQINGKRVEAVKEIGRHGDFVGGLALDSTAERLASAGYDGRIRLWNLQKASLDLEFTALPGAR